MEGRWCISSFIETQSGRKIPCHFSKKKKKNFINPTVGFIKVNYSSQKEWLECWRVLLESEWQGSLIWRPAGHPPRATSVPHKPVRKISQFVDLYLKCSFTQPT